MNRSTQAKYEFIKLVLADADRYIAKKRTLNPTTAVGIAFIKHAKVITDGVEESLAAAKAKP